MNDAERLAKRVLDALASAPPEAGLLAAETVRKRITTVATKHARVIAARSSWAEVGRMLGIPRQTAFKRFRDRSGDPPT